MIELAIAATAFVAGHLVLSHPLRAPLVGRLGDKGFSGVYAVIALGTLIWTVQAWKAAPREVLWLAPNWAWHLSPLLMLVASILLVSSFTPKNAALAGAPSATRPVGVLNITRHPMMWAFGIWSFVHAWLAGTSDTLILSLAVGGLALVGAALQDGKKRALDPGWAAYEAQTSYFPFARGRFWPGWVPLIGGVLLLAAATWAHPQLGAPAVPPWVHPAS